MKDLSVDLTIIGGGPAGLAAAVEAVNQGIEKVMIIERGLELGGILQQCIHDGFGLHKFNKRLSGGQYAQEYINLLDKTVVDVKLETMVLEINKDKTIYAVNSRDGMLRIKSGAVILAMGCRERTASQAMIFGSRPAGVLTAGVVQHYINVDGYLPGKNAVILGSGDIGLIMARRMTLEGIHVKGVYEVMKEPGGLTRNIVQCLDDYDIPLYLETTVVAVHGKDRISSVTIAKVDDNRKPISGTEMEIDCDLLVLAVGLIPENELSSELELEIDVRTKGPIVDSRFMTSEPGIFAAGNVAAVFDLVDYVSHSGEVAARGATEYLRGNIDEEENVCLAEAGENVSFIIPQKVVGSMLEDEQVFFLRVKNTQQKVNLKCYADNQKVYSKAYAVVAPPEMISCKIKHDCRKKLKIQVEV